MQIRQRILKCTDVQVLNFFLANSETCNVSHAFLPLKVAKLSIVKNSPFWPTLHNLVTDRIIMGVNAIASNCPFSLLTFEPSDL